MGCDIHLQAQKRDSNGQWETVPFVPFDWRSYGMFGFLGLTSRNYSDVPPIAPLRGLPPGAQPNEVTDDSQWGLSDRTPYFSDFGDHSFSWLSLEELLAFNYDATFEDRRITVNGNGGVTSEPGGGSMTTYRDFLGLWFFRDLEKCKELGVERIVFGFDN